MNGKNITLEAVGEFPFTFYIEKAVALDDVGVDEKSELILEGIASTTNIDHDKERMSKDALRAMEQAINKDGVPLRVEHQKDGAAIIGRVFKAWVDDRNQLHVRARLDKSHPVSPILHHSMKNGVKMGLSVGGLVKRAMKEFSEATGGMVKTFYDVMLQEVSVTPRPANYDSWLIAKSIAKDMKEAEEFSENEALRREFLFENSQLDYLQAFAKSVPDKAWHKVEVPQINKEKNTMEKEIKKEGTEMDTDETKKYASQSDFNNLSKAFKDLVGVVSKGFENVGALLGKAMDGSAKDQANPDKDKPHSVNGVAKELHEEAHDQENPSKDKPHSVNGVAKDGEMETDETKKDMESEDETKKAEDTEEMGETKKDDSTNGTYDIETINRSIESLTKLSKKLEGMKKTETETDETKKAEDTEMTDETKKADDTETMETKKYHPLDVFIVKMTKAMEAVVERMEKKGHRVLGFEKSFIEDIQNNPKIQEEITKLMKVPGFKKSVAMGIPYMATKDGKRLPLIAVSEKVEKSEDTSNKDFRSMYKSKYSSVRESTNE